MPRISKIRIVNFSYNDGNRFIPDELYDLTSSETGESLNTLFNLYNGGGKTVLVQLMMQPVHPKAMAGGRRIEDYFVRSGDHSFILLEWELDESRDKLLIGIAIAASSSNSADEAQRGNHIKYYTFKTVYEGSSPYSIAALELSKNENGKYVPAPFDYIREKAKASHGAMIYYSSDDSVKWAQMLSEEYGIHRTEWETVIETLNKDEGGLNQYFDEAKTSDKLISKFFIPAIEHKLINAASRRTDSSLETMLINYARKITDKENVIKERDTNSRLLGELSEIKDNVGRLYSANDMFSASVSEVYGFKAALTKRISQTDAEISNIDIETEKKTELISHIKYEESSKEYYIAEERFEKCKSAFEEITALLENCKKELGSKKHELDILDCAKLYKEILSSEAKTEELKKLIADKENNSEGAERIASLKYSVFIKAKEAEKAQAQKQEELVSQSEAKNAVLKGLEADKIKYESALEAAKDSYNKANAELDASKNNTDKRLRSLGIELIRKFDGFYSADEINAEKTKRIKLLEQLKAKKVKTETEISQAEIRKSKIPGEKADIQIKQSTVSDDLDKTRAELAQYDSLYKRLTAVCEKYSLSETAVFSGLLKDTIRKDIDTAEADLTAAKNKMQEYEDKKAAAEKGCLHILPEIMRYVESTGVPYMTGEEYLSRLLDDGSISDDKADRILSGYPEFAYSLLFNTYKELQNLLSAGNIDWLPAVVPLFTMEQVGNILDESMEKSAFLSAYDRTYFADRQDYVSRIDEKISFTDNIIARTMQHLSVAKADLETANNFNYSEDWRVQQERIISSFERELINYDNNLKELDRESERLEAELGELKKKLETVTTEINKNNSWLDSFAELEAMLSDESLLYNKQQSASTAVQGAESAYKQACDEYEKCNAALNSLIDKLNTLKSSLGKTKNILDVVDGAKEALVIDGERDSLYSQYKLCLCSMSADLEKLQHNLSSEQDKLCETRKELSAYNCDAEEYKAVSFSPELLHRVKQECSKLDKDRESYQLEYNAKNKEYGSAEEGFRKAQGSITDFGNNPLPKDRIGDDFKARIKAAESEIKALSDNKQKLNDEKRSLERITDQVSSLLEEFKADPNGTTVELEDDPVGQWKTLNTKLKNRRDSYSNMQRELTDRLRDTISEYKETVLSEIIGKLDSVRIMVSDTELKGDRLFTAGESIDVMIDSIEKINSKIETDIREIENDFNDIVEQCFIQGKRMYTDLRMIASSSKAHIYDGKPQTQMVRMDLPDEKEISEEASRVSIRNEIELGANELRDMIKNSIEDRLILKRAKSIVGSECLLHKYIRRESISVKVYKIDLNSANSSYKRWEDALTQSSGAEKFVVFFSVVLTLMNYTRSSAGLISRNTKSVLILDNPFGKITSAHLLKPMFDIAKHFNVQLICLSDINKSDVISCFDCVIKLVIKMQNLSTYEIMTHEGNELIEHGYYKIMNGQLRLF